jgi:hypothetical protein
MAKRTMRKKRGGVPKLAPWGLKNRPLLSALRPRSTRGGTLVSSTKQGFNTVTRDVGSTARSVGRTTTSAVKTVGRDTGSILDKGVSTLTNAVSGIGSFFGRQTRKAKNAVGLNGGKSRKHRRSKSRKHRRSKSRKHRR